MNNELKKIMEDYICQVEQMCTNLLKGLGLHNKTELIKYIYKERIFELTINNIQYKFHGSGCNAYYDDKEIQWDFGRRSHWCGIDPWFVFRFITYNANQYPVSFDADFIKMQCRKAVESGEMYFKNERYYFNIPLEETFSPQFPDDFDSIVLEYDNKSWTIPKNKEIIRFIRKSVFVYNHIHEIEDKYILNFCKDNVVIFTIPYSDICYPENAVVIMTDRIIRNLEKE